MKLGDVVRLKSGGPAMTVCTQVSEETAVLCMWFVETQPGVWSGVIMREWFGPDLLEGIGVSAQAMNELKMLDVEYLRHLREDIDNDREVHIQAGLEVVDKVVRMLDADDA